MFISGLFISADDKGFIVCPSMHLNADGFDYVPFTSEGVLIKYSKSCKKIANYTCSSPKDIMNEYIGKEVKIKAERKIINRTVKTEIGTIKKRSLYFIMEEIKIL